ncbi:glycosyltransferase [Paenibacillus sp. FSL R5-0407]|uniref:CgeB family protein n=1 Tax=Paenibacillus sp. FSL R5-0407 TaxID=2975320 RepID=UPI0030F73592
MSKHDRLTGTARGVARRRNARAVRTAVTATPVPVIAPARQDGRNAGFQAGFDEGYLRGRMDVISSRPGPAFPLRQIHVMYVTSGKGYPYSPVDEGIIETLRTLAATVTVTDPTQNVSQQAEEARPDLVLALDGWHLSAEHVDSIRNMGIRTALWLTDDPYYTDITADLVMHYDYIFTLELNCVDFYRQRGCANVYYLPFAAYPGYYRPLRERAENPRNLSFVGSAFWNRVEFFQPVIHELMDRGLHINGFWWDRLFEPGAYPGRVEADKWMGPLDTAAIYSSSKIAINLHRSFNDTSVNNNTAMIEAVSPNPRTFEISASGTLQIVDIRSDIVNFYTPGVEIETFSSSSELIEKIDYYLSHEKERREIVLRGLDRTLREHTYAHRLNELLLHVFG